MGKFPDIDYNTRKCFTQSVFMSIFVCLISVFISEAINIKINAQESDFVFNFLNCIKIVNEPFFSTTATFGITTYYQCSLEQNIKASDFKSKKKYPFSQALFSSLIVYLLVFTLFLIFKDYGFVNYIFILLSIIIWILGIISFAESFIKTSNSISGKE